MPNWGPRSRDELEHWLGRVIVLDFDDAISATLGRICAAARRRGRLRPANDSSIAACCLARGLPFATLSIKDFEHFGEYEGLDLVTR
jgi:toxin FitB